MSKRDEIQCPHCKKPIHFQTIEFTALKNVKRHFQEVKAQLKLLNYLFGEHQKDKKK